MFWNYTYFRVSHFSKVKMMLTGYKIPQYSQHGQKNPKLLLQEASPDFLRHTGEMPLVTVIIKSFEGVGKQVGLARQSGKR